MLKKTTSTLKKSEIKPAWYLVDLKNKVLGRAVTKIAGILLGKNKATFSTHIPSGGYVVIVNCKDIHVSGNKNTDKMYYRYSGYPGGLKQTNFDKLQESKPEEIIKHALWGMLPKNRLGKELMSRVFIYPDQKHPHDAQKPIEVEV